MTDEIITRARKNLLMVRKELAEVKSDLADDPHVDLEELLLAVEIVKADAVIAQAELLARIADQLGGSNQDD